MIRAAGRLRFEPVEGAEELFTVEFVDFLVALHDSFTSRIHKLRVKRLQVLERALKDRQLPSHLPVSEINTGGWKVPPVPEELTRYGIEISGPASITPLFINALNPGPGGNRAEGYLDDDEDSAGHRLIDTVTAARNRLGAVNRTITYHDADRGKAYTIQDGEIPFFMHRERGLHLDEPDVTVDGQPVPAALLGTALTLFHAGRAQIARGQGVYFYLPKLESVEETAVYREIFDATRAHLDLPESAVIRAIPLMESLPAAYLMEEMLYALGPYAAGLNAARWDFKASIFEFVMTDPNAVWPDRFGIDIKTTDFLANIFRRLVAVCLKRGAVPIGGMATALPSRDQEVNEVAGASIRNDKAWEADQGFLRGWVAHIFHMDAAAGPFKDSAKAGGKLSPEQMDPDTYPISIAVPEGSVTLDGTRRNVRMLVEYVEGWLNGRGAKGIDSLAGRPGIHPALMEDLATGRMSVAQIAQRVIHSTVGTDTGETHSLPLVKRLLEEEATDIMAQLESAAVPEDPKTLETLRTTAERYRKAVKIAARWVKNYTELDFRSLGSYTRDDLEDIAVAADAF